MSFLFCLCNPPPQKIVALSEDSVEIKPTYVFHSWMCLAHSPNGHICMYSYTPQYIEYAAYNFVGSGVIVSILCNRFKILNYQLTIDVLSHLVSMKAALN